MKYFLGTLIIFVVAISCNNSSSQTGNDKITKWAVKNSQNIETLKLSDKKDDLQLLGQIAKSAEVVCLGESRHDMHEQFLMKNRFVKFLVEELNFKTFVLEASLPYSININNYIVNGTGNIDDIMSNMPGWFLWDTREMKEILEWLHEYNQTQDIDNQVNFYGIDIVAPNNALAQIFDYLQKVDNSYFEQIKNEYFARNIIEDLHWPTTLQHYSELSEKEKQILAKNYNGLYQHLQQNKTGYIDKSSQDEYDRILILAYSANEANKMFSETDRMKMGLIRDNAMAHIALWIKEKNEKMIIWAHNVHIAKSEFTMNMFPETPLQGMGFILNQELKDKMISIGASFNQGQFQAENRTFEPAEATTIDGTLAALKMEYFLLNLNEESGDKSVKAWLNEPNTIRGQEFEMTCKPIQSFDALFFTNTVSKVNYNPSTIERLRN